MVIAFWLVMALVFAVAEALTTALFAVFVTIGAVGAALAAWLGLGVVGQATTFLVVSVAGLLVARPPLMRYLKRQQAPVMLSGAQEMIGRSGVIVEAIQGSHHPGHVEIMGERWPAVSVDGNPVKPGQEVRVVEIRHATLVVAP